MDFMKVTVLSEPSLLQLALPFIIFFPYLEPTSLGLVFVAVGCAVGAISEITC